MAPTRASARAPVDVPVGRCSAELRFAGRAGRLLGMAVWLSQMWVVGAPAWQLARGFPGPELMQEVWGVRHGVCSDRGSVALWGAARSQTRTDAPVPGACALRVLRPVRGQQAER